MHFGETLGEAFGSAVELLEALLDKLTVAFASRFGDARPARRRVPGTTYRPRRAMTLTGVDLRHPELASSFRVSLTKDSRLRVVREAQPAGTELGVVLVGEDSAIPEEHRAIARAYGYELPLKEDALDSMFIALPPSAALADQPARRLH